MGKNKKIKMNTLKKNKKQKKKEKKDFPDGSVVKNLPANVTEQQNGQRVCYT